MNTMTLTSRNWYVFDGAPCSGKTTTLHALADLGYPVAHESAREYIEEELAKGKTIQQIHEDEAAFQREILERKLARERSYNPVELRFFDRGIPDTRAYLRMRGVPEWSAVAEAIAACSYRHVFIFQPLPIVQEDARPESAEEQQAVHQAMLETYRELFPLTVVPVLPVSERVEFVLRRLQVDFSAA